MMSLFDLIVQRRNRVALQIFALLVAVIAVIAASASSGVVGAILATTAGGGMLAIVKVQLVNAVRLSALEREQGNLRSAVRRSSAENETGSRGCPTAEHLRTEVAQLGRELDRVQAVVVIHRDQIGQINRASRPISS